MPSLFTSPADATDAPNDSLGKLPLNHSVGARRGVFAEEWPIKHKCPASERASSNAGAEDNIIETVAIEIAKRRYGVANLFKFRAGDNRIGIDGLEPATQWTVKEIDSASLNPSRIIAPRADNYVIETVVVYVSGGGGRNARIIAECLGRDNRVRISGIDISRERAVEEIGAPREIVHEIIRWRAHDQVRNTIAIHITGRSGAPSKIVISALR
jgi:hypothetical protein